MVGVEQCGYGLYILILIYYFKLIDFRQGIRSLFR